MAKLTYILFSLIIVIAIISGIAGTTSAYFNDMESSAGKSIIAGTLDLKLSNNAVTYTDGVTATWGGTSCQPGDSFSGTVTLKNAGSVTADHVDIKFVNVVINNTSYNAADLGPDITDMSTVMQVTALSYGGTDLLAKTGGVFNNLDIKNADSDSNGIITLKELNNVVLGTLTPLAAPAANGGTKTFDMTVEIPSNTPNGIQGDSVITTVTFSLFQVAGQHLS